MRSIKPLLAVLGLTLSASAMAVPVTDVFTVTLPGAQAGYSAGHVFSLTVTYDDASTSMQRWSDGANGVAESGLGDDTLFDTYNILPDYAGYTLFSDAQVTITGLESPAFSEPLDTFNLNYAWYFEYQNPATDGYWNIQLVRDDLELSLFSVADGYQDADAYQYFSLQQFFGMDGRKTNRTVELTADSFVTRERITTSVPEPGTLALLGMGVVAIALYGRRKQRTRQSK